MNHFNQPIELTFKNNKIRLIKSLFTPISFVSNCYINAIYVKTDDLSLFH